MLAPARTHKYKENCPNLWVHHKREAQTPAFAVSYLQYQTYHLLIDTKVYPVSQDVGLESSLDLSGERS